MRAFCLMVLSLAACTAQTSEPEPRTTPTSATTEAATVAAAETPAAEGPPFNRGAAAKAIGSVNFRACKLPGGPTGPGHVTLLFAVDGTASIRDLDPPYEGTEVGRCLTEKYSAARVPAFSGTPVRVGFAFDIKPDAGG